jgi:DNA-binding beta-propeller fold protein YncE
MFSRHLLAILPLAGFVLVAVPAHAYTDITPSGLPLAQPDGLAVDVNGNVFVADRGTSLSNGALYEIQAAGGYTSFVQLGSGFAVPRAIAVDGDGNLFVADLAAGGEVCEIPPAAVPAANGCASRNAVLLGTGFGNPGGVALDGKGNIFVPDTTHGAVDEIPAGGGAPIPVAGGFVFPQSVALDGRGNVFVLDIGASPNAAIYEIAAGSGTPVRIGGGFTFPQGIAVDVRGAVFLADEGRPGVGGGIEKVTEFGNVTLPGSPAVPNAVALDSLGNIYFIDANLAPAWVDEIVNADPAPVPALGTWALLLCSLLLGAAGVLAARRRAGA